MRAGTVGEAFDGDVADWRRPLLSPMGFLVAACLFGASLTPSLIPREPVVQGVLGGLVGIFGYGIAVAVRWLWRYLGLPMLNGPGRRYWAIACYLGALLIVIFCLSQAAAWQNATRAALQVEPVATAHPFEVAGVALIVFVAVWLVSWGIAAVLGRVNRLLARAVPPRVGQILGLVLVGWLVWALVDGVLIQRALSAADGAFETADRLIDPEIPAPTEPGRTGGPGSLVAWDEMGRWGRSFVAKAPTRAEIAEFAGDTAMDPIRVYVGRLAGETPEARADLALRELIRQGGFKRSALVVAVPVGTGWMDPGAHDTLDFMLGGDVATVSVQYSYLTSVLSLYVHPDYGVAQARALFDKVYDYWAALPPDARPKLYVHGLSQGAFNSQETLPLLDMLADPINGAMWAGSPFFSRFWAQVRDGRVPGSPDWRPEFGNGSLARSMTQGGVTSSPGATWGPIRLVFLNYGSDPIVVFNAASTWRRPDWLSGERAPDVSPALRWFPVVTMMQTAFDMAVSLKIPRVGHFYVAPDYIDAWAALMDPPGWTPARAEELKALFAARPAPF